MKQRKPRRNPKPTSAQLPPFEAVIDPAIGEVRSLIDYLIEHREQLMLDELVTLERESRAAAERLRELDRRKLRVELEGFRDVLRLQQRRIEDDLAPRR